MKMKHIPSSGILLRLQIPRAARADIVRSLVKDHKGSFVREGYPEYEMRLRHPPFKLFMNLLAKTYLAHQSNIL